jgi:serine/threonine protein kinase
MEDSGQVRIADFGLATITQNLDSMGNTTAPRGHTPRWTAPEILEGGKHSQKGDIFSFAMVMVEVCLGKSAIGAAWLNTTLYPPPQVFNGDVPFSGSPGRDAIVSIMRGKRPERPTHPTFTEDLWLLMRRCWDDDHNLRPQASEVLETLEVLTCRRLTSHTFTRPQRICLIKEIFLDYNWTKVIDHVYDDYAQDFLDAVDEVKRHMIPCRTDELTNGGSNFHIFSIRCWKASHQRFAGDVCPP